MVGSIYGRLNVQLEKLRTKDMTKLITKENAEYLGEDGRLMQ